MTNDDLLGRDLTTAVTLMHAQLRAAQELASMANIQSVLGRAQLSDYQPGQTVRGLERCAEHLLEYRRILFYRVMMTNPDYESGKMAEACGRIYDVLAQENDPARPQPLPRVDAKQLDGAKFHEQFILRPHAVLIDNWGFEVDQFQLDGLVAKYGDEPQPLLHSTDWTQYEGPLRDIVEKGAYLANSERLLAHHPELLDGLGADRFRKLSRLSYMSSQLFAGSSFPGSVAHFATTANLFFQVQGSKKWTLIDPAFSYFTYPLLNTVDGYTALSWLDEHDAERCPLYRFCPRFEVDLVPGDLLFNPRYWMHSVVNLTQQSAGVAVRWMGTPVSGSQSPCALFDIALQLNPRRMTDELAFLLSFVNDEPWFESHVHGRTYRYDPEAIARSFGVAAWDPTQKPRFRDPLSEPAHKPPVSPR